jgi:hypothetical protein
MSKLNEEFPEKNLRSRVSERVTGLLVIESIALAIALVTPITPSKTGSTWSPADLMWTDPTYLQKVAASFVVVNLLIAVLGLAALAVAKWSGPE